MKANTPGCYKYDAGAFYPGAALEVADLALAAGTAFLDRSRH
jgi:hypothetical protein